MSIKITDTPSKISITNQSRNIDVKSGSAVNIQTEKREVKPTINNNIINVKDKFSNTININTTKEDISLYPRRGLQGLQGPAGPEGPAGPQGETGPQGPQGPSGNVGTSLTGPAFTYTGDNLTRIDYDSGAFKTISYNTDGSINQVVLTDGTSTITKTFSYNTDGTLSEITQS